MTVNTKFSINKSLQTISEAKVKGILQRTREPCEKRRSMWNILKNCYALVGWKRGDKCQNVHVLTLQTAFTSNL